MRVFLLFLDGVGIGVDDADVNPFFRARMPALRRLLGGALPHRRKPRISSPRAECFGVDATLGVAGLPQSGTGQATIFTGHNAAKLFGRHFGPYIPTDLRPLVAQENLFRVVRSGGKKAVLANAFPRRYFEFTQNATRRLSAITFSAVSSGVGLFGADALAQNKAVSADFVRERWGQLGHPDISEIAVEEAGRHCAEIVREHDLTVFDYWLTDHAGHRQRMDDAVRTLELLDGFLGAYVRFADARGSAVIAVSDHGNVEDLSVKSHTRNASLGLALGRGRHVAAETLRSLVDIAPYIRRCLKLQA